MLVIGNLRSVFVDGERRSNEQHSNEWCSNERRSQQFEISAKYFCNPHALRPTMPECWETYIIIDKRRSNEQQSNEWHSNELYFKDVRH